MVDAQKVQSGLVARQRRLRPLGQLKRPCATTARGSISHCGSRVENVLVSNAWHEYQANPEIAENAVVTRVSGCNSVLTRSLLVPTLSLSWKTNQQRADRPCGSLGGGFPRGGGVSRTRSCSNSFDVSSAFSSSFSLLVPSRYTTVSIDGRQKYLDYPFAVKFLKTHENKPTANSKFGQAAIDSFLSCRTCVPSRAG